MPVAFAEASKIHSTLPAKGLLGYVRQLMKLEYRMVTPFPTLSFLVTLTMVRTFWTSRLSYLQLARCMDWLLKMPIH